MANAQAIDVEPTLMLGRRTCLETGESRQRVAMPAGLTARPRWVVRRGRPGDYTEWSIGFIVGAPLAVAVFVASAVGAFRGTRFVRAVCATVAVLVGSLIGPAAFALGSASLLARMINKHAKSDH